MIHKKKIVVVLPAYEAEKTLMQTYSDIPHDIVDLVLMVDDASTDNTVALARKLGIQTIVHKQNRGYGGNQKTCYIQALRANADIIIMLHPDYQYDPRLVTAMASLIASGVYDCVLGSRILGDTAFKGGMPRYKYIANRCLTMFQNIIMGTKLSEFHTGYRAFSCQIIENLALKSNSNDFIFDNQMLAQIIASNYQIGEISCPTRYLEDSSSITFKRSIIYGFGVLLTSIKFRLWRLSLLNCILFSDSQALKLKPSEDLDT